jgi:hypothetical protein
VRLAPFEDFKAKLKAAGRGQFGSGWAFLVHDGTSLAVISTPNQNSPISGGTTLILGVDVWEHAYYLSMPPVTASPATLIVGFHRRSPELAAEFECMMADDRDVALGALDTVSDWRLTRACRRARATERTRRLRAHRRDHRSRSLVTTGD